MTGNFFHQPLLCWTVSLLQAPGKEQASLEKSSTSVVLNQG